MNAHNYHALACELVAADKEYDEARSAYDRAVHRNYVANKVLKHSDPILIRLRETIERRRIAMRAIQELKS